MFNRNAILAGGIRPHYYCLPVLKREHHRQALLQAATSNNPKFFLGTDSAPHLTVLKENSCGCAGCYTAYGALEMYAQIFEQAGALDKLEAFASFYGADFYGLPRNTQRIILQKQAWTVPEYYGEPENRITPLMAGENLAWQVLAD
jgi:dihydroorotase